MPMRRWCLNSICIGIVLFYCRLFDTKYRVACFLNGCPEYVIGNFSGQRDNRGSCLEIGDGFADTVKCFQRFLDMRLAVRAHHAFDFHCFFHGNSFQRGRMIRCLYYTGKALAGKGFEILKIYEVFGKKPPCTPLDGRGLSRYNSLYTCLLSGKRKGYAFKSQFT